MSKIHNNQSAHCDLRLLLKFFTVNKERWAKINLIFMK